MKLGIEGIYFNIIKVIYDKPVVNIILKGKKTQSIFSKVRNKKSISTLIQHNFVIPSQSTKTGRRDKRSTNWKDSSQSILFANVMILYLKDLKNSTKKTPRQHKQLQKSSRIENQFTKINSPSI
jgi:hypothetical protein